MLPTEAFAEVIAFLELVDLDALILTNVFCSKLAQESALRIRVQDFSHLKFVIRYGAVVVIRPEYPRDCISFCFSSYDALLNAFRNCIIGHLTIDGLYQPLMNAVKNAADKLIVHTLELRCKWD